MSSLIWQPEPITSDLDRMVHYTGLWGVDGVELRTVGKHHERVPWVNEAPIRHRVAAGELSVAVCDPGWLTCGVEDRSAWLNDMTQFVDMVSFNRRMRVSTTLLGALSGSGALPMEPYLRMCERAASAGQSVVIDGDDERVGALLAGLAGQPVRRMVTLGLHEPSVPGDPATIGILRLTAVPVPEFDQDALQKEWTGFLRDMHSRGFSGDIVVEFASNDAGKVGLRLFTLLIRAMRASGLETAL